MMRTILVYQKQVAQKQMAYKLILARRAHSHCILLLIDPEPKASVD